MKNIFYIALLISFLSNAQITLIPDTNFEQALIDQNIDSDGILNGQVLTADINTLTTLVIANNNMTDATGIEDFVTLETLRIVSSALIDIDVSNLIQLKTLDLGNNNISTLNVNNLILLENLALNQNNLLATLDFSNNLALIELILSNNANPIENIDISANVNLEIIGFENIGLTTLNVSQNTLLQFAVLNDNNLTAIDLSLHSDLLLLDVDNNDLSTLNVKNGNNMNMIYFSALNNANLTCIEVDDAAYSTANFTNIDVQTSFSESCPDTENPVAICQDAFLQLDANGEATLNVAQFDNGSTDNIGIASMSLSRTDFTCADIPNETTVTLTVTDTSGNIATCNASVFVNDATNPIITCPSAITVDPGVIGSTFTVPDFTQNLGFSVSDNCSDLVNITTTQSPTIGVELSDGIHTITMTSEDEFGNSTNCTFQLTVDSTLSISTNLLAENVLVYPNPTTKNLTIEIKGNRILKEVIIYDLLGKKLLKLTTNIIELRNFVSGIYYVKIMDDNNHYIIKKIIKK